MSGFYCPVFASSLSEIHKTMNVIDFVDYLTVRELAFHNEASKKWMRVSKSALRDG